MGMWHPEYVISEDNQDRINVLTSQFEFGLKMGGGWLENTHPTLTLPVVTGRE